jgi:hypothetical protein
LIFLEIGALASVILSLNQGLNRAQKPINSQQSAHNMKKISRSSPAIHNSSTLTGQLPSSPLRTASGSKEISYEQAVVPPQYPHRLSLYLQAPSYEITIEDFEELALARLERTFTILFSLF